MDMAHFLRETNFPSRVESVLHPVDVEVANHEAIYIYI